MNNISNHEQIAGVPALAIREFFAACDDPITATDVQSWLNLDDRKAIAVFERLITEGYLEARAGRRQTRALFKTRKAHDVVHAASVAPLMREEAHAILLKVITEVERINGSSEVAHRIDEISLKGPLLVRPEQTVPYLDVEIFVIPLSSDPPTQQKLEALAKEELERRGWQVVNVADQRNWSVRLIEAYVLGVSPHVCVRTIFRDR